MGLSRDTADISGARRVDGLFPRPEGRFGGARRARAGDNLVTSAVADLPAARSRQPCDVGCRAFAVRSGSAQKRLNPASRGRKPAGASPARNVPSRGKSKKEGAANERE